jgi:hypothetical protein
MKKCSWLLDCLKEQKEIEVQVEDIPNIEERVILILEQKLIPLIEKIVENYLAKKGLKDHRQSH